jgi:UDP-sugar diphosphatase
MLNKIKDIKVKKVEKSTQKELFEVSFTQDGKKIKREVLKIFDVVKILIYHEEKNAFILVKQFRPFVYINHPSLAVRYELCGGRVDKPISNIDIAREEILEECGYNVDVKDIKKVTTLVTTSKMTLYFVKVNESMRVNSGGGVDYEMIEQFFLPIKDAKEFMYDETIPKRPGLMFMFCWFLTQNMK